MADTIRTRANLLALLQDNVSRQISPQIMRDVLVSTFGVFGSMSFVDLTNTGQTLNTGAQKLTGWDLIQAEDPLGGVSVNLASSQIDLTVDGFYLCLLCLSMSLSAGATLTTILESGGVTVPGARSVRVVSSDGDVGAFGVSGILQGSSGNSVQAKCSIASGTASVDGICGTLTVLKIG